MEDSHDISFMSGNKRLDSDYMELVLAMATQATYINKTFTTFKYKHDITTKTAICSPID
jgi:hypothetical protein